VRGVRPPADVARYCRRRLCLQAVSGPQRQDRRREVEAQDLVRRGLDGAETGGGCERLGVYGGEVCGEAVEKRDGDVGGFDVWGGFAEGEDGFEFLDFLWGGC
jgi:hypothetical protein